MLSVKDVNLTLWPMGKWGIAIILEMVSRRAKQSDIQESWVVGHICNFYNLGQWPSFMSQNGDFENRPVSRKPLPVER